MKNNFVPVEKMNKKARRAYNNARRTTWKGLSPVTRKKDCPCVYNRAKAKAATLRSELNYKENTL